MARGQVATSRGDIINMDNIIAKSTASNVDQQNELEAPQYDPAAAKREELTSRGFVPNTDGIREIVFDKPVETPKPEKPQHSDVKPQSISDATKIVVKPRAKKPDGAKPAETSNAHKKELGSLVKDLKK